MIRETKRFYIYYIDTETKKYIKRLVKLVNETKTTI